MVDNFLIKMLILAVHARNFNYSSKSIVKSKADTEKLGIKTVFMSNSFAAYRRSVFEALGGFLNILSSLKICLWLRE